jgi:hypothetical protein
MSRNDDVTAAQLRYKCTMFAQNPLQASQSRFLNTIPGPGRLACLFAVLVLTGCAQENPNSAFERYLDRLSGALSVEVAPTVSPSIAALPAARDLQLDIIGSDIDVLDFLTLSGCELQVTIGKRNSSLGRLARDSQRLLLELEYLRLAPTCIAYQREQGELALAETLEEAWAMKQKQLPALIFNATLGGEEYRQFWKAPAQPGNYPANTSSAVISSLQAVNDHTRRWLTGDFSANNLEFELLLSDITAGDGGALRQALAAQASALQAANLMLDRRMLRGPLCTPPLRPAAADILNNVIRKFFIAGTQPRAAQLNRRYHELLPPVANLEQMLSGALPPAYKAWQQQRDEALAQWVLAPREHVSQLQALQQSCDTGEQLVE